MGTIDKIDGGNEREKHRKKNTLDWCSARERNYCEIYKKGLKTKYAWKVRPQNLGGEKEITPTVEKTEGGNADLEISPRNT